MRLAFSECREVTQIAYEKSGKELNEFAEGFAASGELCRSETSVSVVALG
jgi:hypothetical protein